jgi:predicted transcriptional regulator
MIGHTFLQVRKRSPSVNACSFYCSNNVIGNVYANSQFLFPEMVVIWFWLLKGYATPQLSPAHRKFDNEHSGNFSACNNTKITEYCKEETDQFSYCKDVGF